MSDRVIAYLALGLLFIITVIVLGVVITMLRSDNVLLEYDKAKVEMHTGVNELKEALNDVDAAKKELHELMTEFMNLKAEYMELSTSLDTCVLQVSKCEEERDVMYVHDPSLFDPEVLVHIMERYGTSMYQHMGYYWAIEKDVKKVDGWRVRFATWNDPDEIITQTHNDERKWFDSPPRRIMLKMNTVVISVEANMIPDFDIVALNGKESDIEYTVRDDSSTNKDFRKGKVSVYIPIDIINNGNPRDWITFDAEASNQAEVERIVNAVLLYAPSLIAEIKAEAERVNPSLLVLK